MDLRELWPLFGLRLRTPRLELAPMTDPDLAELAALAAAGVHDPQVMPFAVPWTDGPAAEIPRRVLTWHWSQRAAFDSENWVVEFGVRHKGRIIGSQGISATHFPLTRTISSGSWLGCGHQGRGFGTEMRAAVVALAFDHLGADRCESAAFLDNPASLRVSEKLGYRPNGDVVVIRRPGEAVVNQRLLLRPEWFRRPDWQLRVEGLDPCRALLGG